MPDVSGKDIVRVLKQDFHTEKIPIILFSSKSDDELAEISEQAGSDGFLSSHTGSTGWATWSTRWWTRSW